MSPFFANLRLPSKKGVLTPYITRCYTNTRQIFSLQKSSLEFSNTSAAISSFDNAITYFRILSLLRRRRIRFFIVLQKPTTPSLPARFRI